MLASLHIENVAVIKSLDVDFESGFTALTGETGAGKSIIIDSLGLLLGNRADRELIRSGERTALVSGLFVDLSARVRELLCEMGFDTPDGTVLLSRTLQTEGSSVARLNGRSITLSMLREIAAALFNIHGQNDNQQLLDRRHHLAILDSYAASSEELSAYGEAYRHVLHLRMQIESVRQDAMESARMQEMLRYQLKDIDALRLKEGEEERLEAESRRLGSLERIHKGCALVDKALRGGEKGVGAIYLTDRASAALSQLSDAIPEGRELSERLVAIRYELSDIADTVSAFGREAEEDPTEKIDRIESRLNEINKLKRKYGSTIGEILAFRREVAERLDVMEHAEEHMEDLENELSVAEDKAREIALRLHARRKEASESLTASVTEALSFLDMPKVRFSVSLAPASDFGPAGLDDVEFLLSANPGEPLLPLSKIASGGELARIMLTLKSVLNRCDGVETVIFDEIDTGISGKTSRKVGIKLCDIAKEAQVICVTHSAQIASLAHTHLYVSKQEIDGRTQSALRVLDPEERVEEISRILGGIEITASQRSAACEMIEEGRRYR